MQARDEVGESEGEGWMSKDLSSGVQGALFAFTQVLL
jgi:hypothetical protein